MAYSEPKCRCQACRRDFSPQRPGLRLTPHSYSPSVLGKIVRSAARQSSFEEATKALEDLAELTISGRQVGRIAREVGEQLQARRDDRAGQPRAEKLPPRVETRPALAVVEVDGGRLRIRGEGEVPGAHEAAWREDNIAMLATAAITASAADPEPELPACFRDRGYVEKLVRGIGGVGRMGPRGRSGNCWCGPMWPVPAAAMSSARWSPKRRRSATS